MPQVSTAKDRPIRPEGAGNAPLNIVRGQPSWGIPSSRSRAWLTRLGGHLGPIEFKLGSRTIAPLSVAPWAEERLAPGTPPLLRALRGDFFCAPFGGNAAPWHGESHPGHGETANRAWRHESLAHENGKSTLHTSLVTRIRPGRVDKYVTLIDGQTVAYQRHILSGSSGPMNLGHHAMVKFPETPGSGLVSTSRFVRGQVLPDPFETPGQYGYQALKRGALFRTLRRVPLATGGAADLSRYPARKGFEDLVMLTADPELPFAWTAVVFPRKRYVWFSLRDPQLLRHTIMWHSNGGRHYPPWNGRHTAVLGLEDVTSYFHYGLAESARSNPLSRRGIPTVLRLDAKRPTTITHIMGVAALPPGFDHVREIRRRPGGIELRAANGLRARCAVDVDFLARR